jgi:hypothetical protein
MKEENEWVFYKDIEWDDPKFNVFSIDTRDFHCGYRLEENPHKDIDTLKKYPEFFHTEDELKALINRYYDESGGNAKWRFFYLEGVDNWGMKYIRIWKTELGFVVCNSDNRALKKDFLSVKVAQDHLNAH